MGYNLSSARANVTLTRIIVCWMLWAFAAAHAQTWVTLPGDRQYQGSLEDGEPYGVGTMVYPNGTRYTGDFIKGSREGRGTAIFFDGTRYEGEWRGDVPHGQGVFTTLDGQRYEGEFVNGEWRDAGR